MKAIALHLPQFHEIPENDEWWGKGFTEWTNVRKAKPLFKNHYQPRVPLNENYYKLDTRNAIEWQCKTAKQYGIHGFCFYHYWFNGKLLLEKPVELLLNHKEIDSQYCLSWANEPWTRSWDGSNKTVIMPQSYGDRSNWDLHFKYLSKFFLDHRYIKINGRPLFLIYRPSSIPNLGEMLERWDRLAIEYGIESPYIIQTLTSFDSERIHSRIDAFMHFEPWLSIAKNSSSIQRMKWKLARASCLTLNKIFDAGVYHKYSYDEVWNIILNRKYSNTEIPCAFVDWDNTPRRGVNATVIDGASPEKFGKYFKDLTSNVKSNGGEIVFINAWNEWAEGAYLEPDERHGYNFLNEVLKAMI
jgi:lipopolysaccharide biosynthesis protein